MSFSSFVSGLKPVMDKDNKPFQGQFSAHVDVFSIKDVVLGCTAPGRPEVPAGPLSITGRHQVMQHACSRIIPHPSKHTCLPAPGSPNSILNLSGVCTLCMECSSVQVCHLGGPAAEAGQAVQGHRAQQRLLPAAHPLLLPPEGGGPCGGLCPRAGPCHQRYPWTALLAQTACKGLSLLVRTGCRVCRRPCRHCLESVTPEPRARATAC